MTDTVSKIFQVASERGEVTAASPQRTSSNRGVQTTSTPKIPKRIPTGTVGRAGRPSVTNVSPLAQEMALRARPRVGEGARRGGKPTGKDTLARAAVEGGRISLQHVSKRSLNQFYFPQIQYVVNSSEVGSPANAPSVKQSSGHPNDGSRDPQRSVFNHHEKRRRWRASGQRGPGNQRKQG